MKRVDNIHVPDEFLAQLDGEAGVRRMLEELSVIEAVRRHFISRGQGAELLGLSLWDFDEVLAEHNVPTLDLTPEELVEQTRPLS